MAELALADRMRVSHSHLKGGPVLWTPEDIEKAVAFQAYEALRCRTCGWHPEEPMEAHASRCPGCEQIGDLQFAHRDAPPHETHGVRYGLRHAEEEAVAS